MFCEGGVLGGFARFAGECLYRVFFLWILRDFRGAFFEEQVRATASVLLLGNPPIFSSVNLHWFAL